ncbi:hypothetical protein ASE61_19620 [Bosea sp. Root670]|uniref:SPW repeat protein n=1 Tax=Bosea sp. Root670 TaxID=1736583 RepID=UPI000712B0C8|nr:SPW repeat protein [Bosea sp. Root670]KRE00679.1 hypothetical protein ASE61_19620 [Bosea sp. Root670]
MKNEVPSKGLEWTNLILGVSLACASMAFAGSPLAAWNAGITGGLIACLSAIALYRNENGAARYNLILGSWAVIAPFVLGFGAVAAPMWTHVVMGLCIAAIAATQILAKRSARPAPLK